jgi:hypothetical protein
MPESQCDIVTYQSTNIQWTKGIKSFFLYSTISIAIQYAFSSHVLSVRQYTLPPHHTTYNTIPLPKNDSIMSNPFHATHKYFFGPFAFRLL